MKYQWMQQINSFNNCVVIWYCGAEQIDISFAGNDDLLQIFLQQWFA